MGTRRRGEELENALLDAAWEELLASGYANLTMDAVAARAGTSRPVLYRRWPDRGQLVGAALRHVATQRRVDVPDTGSLRGDVVALMREVNRTRADLLATVSVGLMAWFEDTGTTPAELRDSLRGQAPGVIEPVLERAAARGEIDRERITPRIATLPFLLLRGELLLQLGPVDDAVIDDIVDTVFLPLATGRLAEGSAEPTDARAVDTARGHGAVDDAPGDAGPPTDGALTTAPHGSGESQRRSPCARTNRTDPDASDASV